MRKRSFVLICVSIVAAQVIYAAKVRVDAAPDLNTAQYSKYSWRSHPVFEKHPELLDVYATGIELVKNSVNRNLMKRGYESAEDRPDFYVTFFLTSENRQDVEVVYNSGAYGWTDGWYSWGSNWWGGWSSTVVSHYIRGMLVL